MRDWAKAALEAGDPALPDDYRRFPRLWTTLGVPAFIALVIVLYLMVAKPP